MAEANTPAAATSALSAIRAALTAQRSHLAERYEIRSIGVFGSYAREAQNPNSDIDLLIEFATPPGLFALTALEDELEVLLGRPVDIAVRSALRPHIGARILHEVIPV